MQVTPDREKAGDATTRTQSGAASERRTNEDARWGPWQDGAVATPYSLVDCRQTPGFAGHELVAACHDPASGLRAFIAIHNTTLGPALGGCRMWPYASETEAISDVLRLSQGMSYKHAVASTGQGGGKAVIIGDPRRDKCNSLYRAMGRFVEQLGGQYITAEDVGTSIQDLCFAKQETDFISGLPVDMGGSGDPSPVTAYGVFCGIQAALAFAESRPYDAENRLDGASVAVQGLGNVGYRLCRFLHEAGAKLLVADIHDDIVKQACAEFSAEAMDPERIHRAPADVFAPCALGGAIDGNTIETLQPRIVAGAANNQLAKPCLASRLSERGVLYAPDYVINAGGIINISFEKNDVYNPRLAMRRTRQIGETLTDLFQQAESTGQTTAAVANQLAERKLARAAG
jgi:leucine dehydrogenase